ncbi:protein of unknown function (plasmid) [Caballeronia sp. S22]
MYLRNACSCFSPDQRKPAKRKPALTTTGEIQDGAVDWDDNAMTLQPSDARKMLSFTQA